VTSPAAPETSKTPTRSIILLAVAGFASQAQVRVTDSLLPQIADDFGTTVGTAAMVVTAYAVSHGGVQLLIGPLGDRFGKYLTVGIAAGARGRTAPGWRRRRLGHPALDGLRGRCHAV
jgi:MFS transporter, YNFM family, putative membrane transport protein